jgi:hypothetical protein
VIQSIDVQALEPRNEGGEQELATFASTTVVTRANARILRKQTRATCSRKPCMMTRCTVQKPIGVSSVGGGIRSARDGPQLLPALCHIGPW